MRRIAPRRGEGTSYAVRLRGIASALHDFLLWLLIFREKKVYLRLESLLVCFVKYMRNE